jgi:hypothetical protein
MTDSELATTLKLIDGLRARGVTHFELDDKGGVRFDLALAPEKPTKPTKPHAFCACGHDEWEHNNGACLKGCDETKCEAA